MKKQETVLEDFRRIWGDRFDYSGVEYKGTNTKVKIRCKEHGDFWLYPYQHKSGTKKGPAGCYQCGRKVASVKAAKAIRSNTEEFIIKAVAKFGDLYDYSKVDYQHSHEKVIIGCKLHGDFLLSPGRHLERQGCPTCSSQKSNAEGLWLDSLGLPRDQDHRNFDLKIPGSKCLIDGYDPATKTVYEFHGDFWHGNPMIHGADDVNPLVKKTFGELYRLTLEKEQRIKSAGYNLVTIWESDWKKQLSC
jgi:hypothetical protein